MPRSKARQILRVCHPDRHHHSDRGYHSGTVVRGSIRSRQKMKLTKAVFAGTPVVIRFDPTACQTFKFGTIQCGRDFHGRYNADTNRWTVTGFKHSPLRVRFITIPQSGDDAVILRVLSPASGLDLASSARQHYGGVFVSLPSGNPIITLAGCTIGHCLIRAPAQGSRAMLAKISLGSRCRSQTRE
jgi:hypothetical protein